MELKIELVLLRAGETGGGRRDCCFKDTAAVCQRQEYTPPTSNQVHHRDCRRLYSVCVILRLLFINSYLCFGNYGAHQCNITWLEQVMPYLHHIYALESKNPLFCKFWKTCHGSYFFDTAFNFARLVASYPARGLWSLDASFMNMTGCTIPAPFQAAATSCLWRWKRPLLSHHPRHLPNPRELSTLQELAAVT